MSKVVSPLPLCGIAEAEVELAVSFRQMRGHIKLQQGCAYAYVLMEVRVGAEPLELSKILEKSGKIAENGWEDSRTVWKSGRRSWYYCYSLRRRRCKGD